MQLTLSAGISSSHVIVMLTWTGNDVHHTLSNTMQQISGTSYSISYVILKSVVLLQHLESMRF